MTTPEDMVRLMESPEGEQTARNFLGAFLHLDALMAVKLARLDHMRALNRRLHPDGDTPPDIREAEQAVEKDYHELARRQKAIEAAIRLVPDERQRAILEMRYLEGMPFFRIAMALNYEERQIYRLHKAALRHVAVQLACGAIEAGNLSVSTPVSPGK